MKRATGRLDSDPLLVLRLVETETDIRRRRRAFTEPELQRLLDVARTRPVRDAETLRRGERKGEQAAKLKPEYRATLERRGHERALIYKTLVLTGLRKGELTALRWADVDLDGETAWLTVRAETAKNKRNESIPIRDDLLTSLRAWRTECGTPEPTSLVFEVPSMTALPLLKQVGAARR